MLQSVSIREYKGIQEQHLILSPLTAIVGGNGSGKTHILEAIHLASGGSLHYFHSPRGDQNSVFSLAHEEEIGPKQFALSRIEGKDVFSIQGIKVTGLKYRENLPFRTVMLSPFDMNLLYFAPSVRRDYIDSILSRTFSHFPRVKREYEQALRQRNALLKKIREGEAPQESLGYWDGVFSEKAEMYILYRKKYFDFLFASPLISEFLPAYMLHSFLQTRVEHIEDPKAYIARYLLENRERDCLSGHTHIGPHLDDFGFYISAPGKESFPNQSFCHEDFLEENGLDNATMILSRGEMKTLLLALKQVEIYFLRKYLSVPIILLFDDLFAELDQSHAEHIIDTFDVHQVIVTTQRTLPLGGKWQDFSCIQLKLQ